MFNVDGVIYGNARCDISGSDVNRKWTKNPNSFLYPTTYGAKKLYSSLLNEGYQIDYFIDLHGHSKKLGNFMFYIRDIYLFMQNERLSLNSSIKLDDVKSK